MGFRFRRSIRILPGLRLNIGKRGVSTSIGVRGAHVTFGKNGVRETVGIPGSGLSYTHVEGTHHHAAAKAPEQAQAPVAPTRGTGYYVSVALFAAAIIAAIVAVYHAQP
jgi:hypothetical protein